MKLLDGKELAGFIKERQAKQVRELRQSHVVEPKLAIVQCKDDPVINTYVRLKKQYGTDIQVEVEVHNVAQDKVQDVLQKLNEDISIHGIIVQLPLADTDQTEEVVNLVASEKDVDALGNPLAAWLPGTTHSGRQGEAVRGSWFTPATPMAIMWLLAGYNIDLRGKKVLLVGRGRLVGAPLERILKDSDIDVSSADRETKKLNVLTINADVIITATGSPAILYPDMIKQGAVVVDAGVAGEDGKTVGDLHPSVYERDDLTVTPAKGGVGPLTVCALFDNVIRAARQSAESK
ncbi:MAG: bifunctional 5,10-methylenetetrahydrofolate dehydrogenase/5,10-methenyltetrahydrofolate cyclohydrolase [Candidatus Saccharibacteria bacterium]|nr:bifunctional 5,10-methylenetetrahydrofolate dehydrogenase/5,10-methenyltetrahydrofolate cyclohydrolase [Candidatus Saccharibacteria bacterium]